ncbi:O-antigen ligase family protein [Empedobacter brevis]|nr:O-antigen ligase family protein [Empedobacter brevis]
MPTKSQILKLIEQNKTLIWGLFLSSLIPGHAINSILLIIVSTIFFITIFLKKKINLYLCILPFIVLFMWGILSYFWSTYPPQTLSSFGKTIGLLIIPLAISQYKKFSIKELNITISIFSYSLIAYFFISLIHSTYLFILHRSINVFFYHDLVSIFNNNAIYIALFSSICLLIKFNLPNKTKLDYCIVILLLIFLILLSSKNLIVTTACLLIISSLYKKKNLYLNKKFAFLFIILCGVILFVDNPIKQRFLDETILNLDQILYGQDFSDFEFNGSNLRIFHWRIVFEMINNNQLGFLGTGLGNIDYLTEQYFHYYNLYKGYFAMNFHNQYLQTFGELGVVGLFILLFIFVFSIYKSIKTNNIFLFTVAIILILAFFTESYLNRQKGLIVFTSIICLLSILTYTKNHPKFNKE